MGRIVGHSVCLLLVLLVLPAADAFAAGTMRTRWGGPPIPVHSHEVTATVTEGLAKTTVRQGFVSPWGNVTQAIYEFPLPPGAALIDVAMEVGGRRYEGLLLDRGRARRIYNRLFRRNVDPALVEQIGGRVFRLSVFPVVPKKVTTVELTWVETLPVRNGLLTYTYPLALPDEWATTARRGFAVNVRIDSSQPLGEVAANDPAAEIVRRGARGADVSIAKRGVKLDRDFSVTVALPKNDDPRLSLATWREPGVAGWFLLGIDAPEWKDEEIPPIEAAILIDTSASMRGPKLENAVHAAGRILGRLRDHDLVCLTAFGEKFRSYAKAEVPLGEHREEIRKWLAELTADGHTALGPAVGLAADPPLFAAGRPSVAVLLTDGVPNRGERDTDVLTGIAERTTLTRHRLFVVGMGPDADARLLGRLARAGRGRYFAAPAADGRDRILPDLLAALAPPVLSNVTIAADGADLFDVYPKPQPPIFGGRRTWIAGRYWGNKDAKVTVAGKAGDKDIRLERSFLFSGDAGGVPLVPYVFARRKLDALEDGWPRTRANETEIITLSLASGVQSWATSFLVLLPADRRRLVTAGDEAAVAEALERAGNVRGGSFDPGEVESGVATSGAPGGVYPKGLGSGGSAGGRMAPPRPWWRRTGNPLPEWLEVRNVRRPYHERDQELQRTEAAISRGTRWLSLHTTGGTLDADNFSLRCGASLCSGEGRAGADLLVTSLGLLVDLGEGIRSFTWRDQGGAKSLRWLASVQGADGAFGRKDDEGFLIGHAAATLATVEFWAFSGDKSWKQKAQRALEFLAKCEFEGFRKRHGIRPDRPGLSSDPWTALAIVTGRASKLRTSSHQLSEVLKRLHPEASLLCWVLLGRNARANTGLKVKIGEAREVLQTGTPNPVSLLFAALALRQAGGEGWEEWWTKSRDRLIRAQSEEGDEAGSWEPTGAWGKEGGRVASTALAVMALQAHRRYAVRFPVRPGRDGTGGTIR